MGLLNRKKAAVDKGLEVVLEALSPPYRLDALLLEILNQLANTIPANGYYAYLAEDGGNQLALKVTRAASGIATVGPNYAGLVLGSAIQTVPLDLPPPAQPWVLQRAEDDLLEIGMGAHVLLRMRVEAHTLITDDESARLVRWLKSLAPIVELVMLAEGKDAGAPARRVSEIGQTHAGLWWEIPRLMGLLADLGTRVLNSTDGYLAVFDQAQSADLVWRLGSGDQLAGLVPPFDLYGSAGAYRYAVWNQDQLPETVRNMGFQSLLAVPLRGAGPSGILCFAMIHTLTPSQTLQETLQYLGESLENSLSSQDAAYHMGQNYLDALTTATALLDESDPYNKQHHQEVARLAARLALRAGWSSERISQMELAGRLHDLGMVAVTLDVTKQGGNLSEQAREIIQMHPVIGSDLLAGLPEAILPPNVARAIREHHERWDGLGYPDGLKDTAISEEGRLLAAAEQFVARISHRNYRKGMPVGRALSEVQLLAGSHLDPAVVDLLIGLYQDAGVRPQSPT